MAPRPPKGTPTDSNLHSLARLFGDAQEVSNQVPPTQIASLKRCLAAGLVEIGPSRKTIRLTPAGIEAVRKEREDRARRMGPSVVPSVELARALGVRPNEPITEKALAAKIEAHTQPAAKTEVGGYRVGSRVIHPNMGLGTVDEILPRDADAGFYWPRLLVRFDVHKPGMPARSVLHMDHVNPAPADESTYDAKGLLKTWWRLEGAERAENERWREAGRPMLGFQRPAREALHSFEKAHPEIREAGLSEMSAKEEAEMGRKLRGAARRGLL